MPAFDSWSQENLANFAKETYNKMQETANQQAKFTDLDQLIMQAWSTKEDLDLFLWALMDRPTPMTEDEQANLIIGITALHNSRMHQLYEAYCAFFKCTKE
jgi:hypothetical protein